MNWAHLNFGSQKIFYDLKKKKKKIEHLVFETEFRNKFTRNYSSSSGMFQIEKWNSMFYV